MRWILPLNSTQNCVRKLRWIFRLVNASFRWSYIILAKFLGPGSQLRKQNNGLYFNVEKGCKNIFVELEKISLHLNFKQTENVSRNSLSLTIFPATNYQIWKYENDTCHRFFSRHDFLIRKVIFRKLRYVIWKRMEVNFGHDTKFRKQEIFFL